MGMISRRSFISGLFAAPAIIAIDRLMPVKALKPFVQWFAVEDFGYRVDAHIIDAAGRDQYLTKFVTNRLLTGDVGIELFTIPAGSTLKTTHITTMFLELPAMLQMKGLDNAGHQTP